MNISVYIDLVKYSNKFLSLKLDVEEDTWKKCTDGIHGVIATIEKYFNKGSFISFMSMVLDPRIKDTVYVRNSWKEDFQYMFDW